MMDKKMLLESAFAAVAALGLITAVQPAQAATNLTQTQMAAKKDTNMCAYAPKKGQEACYGIAKAGMNDCKTAQHTCAHLGKKNNNPSDWIDVPKGSCEKIAGGSLKPPEGSSTES